jgi:hypothetical protein
MLKTMESSQYIFLKVPKLNIDIAGIPEYRLVINNKSFHISLTELNKKSSNEITNLPVFVLNHVNKVSVLTRKPLKPKVVKPKEKEAVKIPKRKINLVKQSNM